MSSNNNFLLKIHMEEKNKVKEIILNKERRAFTFVNDECVSDLIIPEFKITSLNMILKNINDKEGNDSCYAEYEIDNNLVREHDPEKIKLLTDMISKISVNDFFEYQKEIKIVDYYVDSIIDKYDCILPIEMKKIVSYTTNGVTFTGKEKIKMLSHSEIVNYKKEIKNFIPIIIKDESNYIGYDYKESLYKEYQGNEKIRESKTFKGVVLPINIEILNGGQEQTTKKIDEFEIFKQELRNEIKNKINVNENDSEYDNKIKNIDYQLERLTSGLASTNKNNKEKYIDKKDEEKIKIKNEIREMILKSIEEIEKTNNLIDEIDNNVEKVMIKKNNIKNKKEKNKNQNQKQKEVVKNHKINENKVIKISKEEQSEKLTEFLKEFDKKQIEKLREKKEQEEKIAKAKQEEAERKAYEEKLEMQHLENLISNSINNGLNNYRINFNDTQKLVIEHLPYYEFTNEFDVIQIPEIEVDKITLLPNGELNFGKLKLVVDKLSNNKVDLLVQSATSISDKNNNKIKPGMHLELGLNDEITLRLNKKNVMETWTLKMEKSTYIKELRNIDYGKIMNYITELEGYKKLGNVEKYELQKSVMLFIDSVMRYDDVKKLEELYKILEKEPTLYEEYITKYNIEHSLELKDSLATYDNKKEFVSKLNYVNGLIDAKWLDYPRYIFETHNYFQRDEFLQEFIDALNDSIKEEDFANYLKKLFKEYEMFTKLDELGLDNLNKCLEYLSVLYKNHPHLGEKYKYQIEKTFMIGANEEDIALLISKLCRRGIKDYSLFLEYDELMKNSYRLGLLQYPIYSESFRIEEIRIGGEYDEF